MKHELSLKKRFLKRVFDITVSFTGLILFSWLIIGAFLIACIDTKSNGFFIQKRVGRWGNRFSVIKIKTMKKIDKLDSTVTTSNDVRITTSGKVFRKLKIDELPQLLNVLVGQMSFVGPRPDVPGYADGLAGNDRVVLSIRPGITGPATLYYRDEEEILANQTDSQYYNDYVIYPHKVKLNKQYIYNYSLKNDIYYIWKTIFK
ncbi:sugar transferase [Pontibacillus yanchengensis]|uniref:Sugar transferase n=1 Tax=Pontibacillus yanchengensis Y32 TaxID=1385514 RepID=A0A0A2TFE4_9BACI|nr:sugar transferase [Pontibacillus yanchengensis]KGP74567.1 sugar transferase [Pontibacillus yanchengensis Y32]